MLAKYNQYLRWLIPLCFYCYHWNFFYHLLSKSFQNILIHCCFFGLLPNIARLNFLKQYLVYSSISFKSPMDSFHVGSNSIILSFTLSNSVLYTTPTFQTVIMHRATTYYLYLYYHGHSNHSTTYFAFICLTFTPVLKLFCYLSCSLHLLLISDLWNSSYDLRALPNVTSFLRYSHIQTIPLTSISL